MNSRLFAFAALALALTSSSAHADTSLVGKWKITGQECASGAPAKNTLVGNTSNNANSGVGTSIDVEMVFGRTDVSMNMNAAFKLSVEKKAEYLKQIDDAIVQILQLPPSPEKDKALQQAMDAKAQIEKLALGFSCTAKTTGTYSLLNSQTIQMALTSTTTDCPGETSQPDGKPTIAGFTLNDDVLKVTSSEVSNEKSNCPVGDKEITVLTRQP